MGDDNKLAIKFHIKNSLCLAERPETNYTVKGECNISVIISLKYDKILSIMNNKILYIIYHDENVSRKSKPNYKR